MAVTNTLLFHNASEWKVRTKGERISELCLFGLFERMRLAIDFVYLLGADMRVYLSC